MRDCFLAGLLISRLTKENIQYNFAFCVGKSYDGTAASMASERSGVTSIVQNESPLAYYFHCDMHCLNLCASAAVKIAPIQNAENVVRKVVKMFKTRAKKTMLLKSYIKEDVSSQGETKRYLVGLCETRFVYRHVSIPVKHSKLGAKNFNKVCPKTVQNALEGPLLEGPFQKFAGVACPWILFFCFSICFKLILPKKTTFEKMSKFGAPFKTSDNASDMKHF